MNSRQQGFTLVEVLIASAIVIASMGVLLQLFAAGLHQSRKAALVAHLMSVQRTIVRQFDEINPAQQTQGSGRLEGVSFHWRAQAAGPFHPFHERDVAANKRFAPYRIELDMNIAGRSRKTEFVRLGWKVK